MKYVATKALKLREDGAFVEAALLGEMGGRRRATATTVKTDASVATDLYKWYADLPKGSRVTKRSCFKKLKELQLERGKAAGDSRRRRSRALKSWRERFNVSFRKRNKQYVISAAEFESRMSTFLKNCIKVRAALGDNSGDMVMINFAQRPLFYDSIADESALVEKGAKEVGANMKESDARDKSATILFQSNKNDLVLPRPQVTFKAVGGGAIVKKNWQQRRKVLPTAPLLTSRKAETRHLSRWRTYKKRSSRGQRRCRGEATSISATGGSCFCWMCTRCTRLG